MASTRGSIQLVPVAEIPSITQMDCRMVRAMHGARACLPTQLRTLGLMRLALAARKRGKATPCPLDTPWSHAIACWVRGAGCSRSKAYRGRGNNMNIKCSICYKDRKLVQRYIEGTVTASALICLTCDFPDGKEPPKSGA